MARSFEEDAELLREYAQFRALNKGKGDTSPEAFLIHQGQQAAFKKLEEVIEWYTTWKDVFSVHEPYATKALGEILE